MTALNGIQSCHLLDFLMGFCKNLRISFWFLLKFKDLRKDTNSWPRGLPDCPRLVPQKPSDPRELAGSSQTETDDWEKRIFHQIFLFQFLEGYDLVGIKCIFSIFFNKKSLIRGGCTDDWNPKAETLAIGALLVDSKKSRTSITQLAVNKILIWWKNVSRSSGASGDQKCIKHGTLCMWRWSDST